MSIKFEEYTRGIPTKPYDLLKEGLIVLAVIAVVVLVLAGIFSSPDYPTIKAEDVAKNQPAAYLLACADILAGNSSIQDYGPPYNADTGNAQRIFGIAPADWFGVTIPIDPPEDFIIKPLERTAVLDSPLGDSISEYQSATADQQQVWVNAYLSGLQSATVSGDTVQLPAGDYGPVADMMNAMLKLGQAGLLEGALEESAWTPFNLDFTQSLLFFQDDVYPDVAEKLDLLGEQWGMSNETGNYPGAWWTWPIAFLYQIPPMSESGNADILALSFALLGLLVLFFWPFIPGLNRLPHLLRVYRLIWHDWYSKYQGH